MRKEKLLALVLVLVMAFTAAPLTVGAADGTAISTAAELTALMNDSSAWGGTYYLAADIDLSLSTKQTPIGNTDVKFTGIFDGNGKTVSGLDITGSKYQGMFGYISNAQIKNLTVKGKVTDTTDAGGAVYSGGVIGCAAGSCTVDNVISYVDVSAVQNGGTQGVGGVIGWVACVSADASAPDKITVSNCHSFGKTSSGRALGNLIGLLSVDGVTGTAGAAGGSITVTGCSSNGEVVYSSATQYGQVGGLVGCIYIRSGLDFAVVINKCTNNSYCSGDTYKERIGGMVGWISGDSASAANEKGGSITFTDCVNNGNIDCTNNSAGILGFASVFNRSDITVKIENCVNNGEINADGKNNGGIFGYAMGGVFTVTGCANYGRIISSGANTGGIVGGADQTAKATACDITIENCANYAALNGNTDVGGIVGFVGTGTLTVKNCFNSGAQTVPDKFSSTGSVISTSYTATAENCFFTVGEDAVYGKLLTAAEAAVKSSYTGWDFTGVWTIKDGVPVLLAFETAAAPDAPAVTTTAPAAPAAPAVTTAPSANPVTGSQGYIVLIFIAAASLAAAGIALLAKKKKA